MTSSRGLMVCGLVVACSGIARLFLADRGWGITFAAITAASGVAMAVAAYRIGRNNGQIRG